MEQKINFNSNGPFSLPRHVHIASSVRVSGKAGEVINVGGDAGQDRGHANQGVEGGDELRQVSDLNLLSDGGSNGSTNTSCGCHLGKNLRVRLEETKGSGNSRCHTNNTKGVTEPGSWLGGKTAKGSNAG